MDEPLTDAECREAVREALDSLPEDMAEQMRNVAVVIEDHHPQGVLGVYDPRGGLKRIVIYRDSNPNVEEIRKTVLHEVGHFFGMNEERLRRLGYQ